jgi:hypothetical protein
VGILSEGLTAFREQTDRRFAAVEREFASVRAEMAQGFQAVHRRVDRLERAT